MVMRNQTLENLDWKQIDPGDIEEYISGRAGGPRLALRLDVLPGGYADDWPVDYPIRVYIAEFTDDLVTSEELERLVEAGED